MITQYSTYPTSSRKVPVAAIAAILLATTIISATLVACGSSSKTSTPQSAHSPTSTLPVYAGKGFTISYPKGWLTNSIDNTYSFNSPIANGPRLNIGFVSDPYGSIGAPTIVSKQYQDFQNTIEHMRAVNVPSTIMIGGDSWSQAAFTGVLALGNSQNQGTLETIIVADTHPNDVASTQAFTILCTAKQPLFATAYTKYFLPMLQSFRFTF